MEAGFFENFHLCLIVFVNIGMDSYRIGMAKIIIYGLFDSFGHDALVPVRFGSQ